MNERSRNEFFAKYRPGDVARQPKHAILRAALVAAIQDGYWKSGERMPTEIELTKITPYSLGTVQRAIQALAADGFVTRKQGSGTFVAPADRRIGGPWIFRFLSEDEQSFATMTTRVVSRRSVTVRAPWVAWLTGGETNKLLEIDRHVVADGRFPIFSRYYLDPARFPIIATKPLRELHGANFAALIQAAYKLPINHIARALQCTRFPRGICRELGAPEGSLGLLLEIAASAGRSRPVFYQQLYIPADSVKLFISDSFDHWITAPATVEKADAAPNKTRKTAMAAGQRMDGGETPHCEPTGSTG